MATYYIDPAWAGTKSGTFAQPWSTYTSLPTLSAGDFVLQKAGTTFTGIVTSNASGAVGNPITYGVYDAVTGLQIKTTLGAATMSGDGVTVSHNFSTQSFSFNELVGFRLSAIKDGTVYGCRLGSNSSGNTDGNAARYCVVENETCAAGFLLFTNLGVVGHTIDHCVSSNNSVLGIFQVGSLIAGKITITNNVCNSNGQSGFKSAFSAAILVSGTIANNTFNYNGVTAAVTGKGIGIDMLSDSADLFSFGNECSYNYTMGIRAASLTGTAAANQHWIENNACQYNGEYGIQVSGGGGWAILNNRCNYNGSTHGSKYGRGIEIFGGSTKPAGPGIVCYNTCNFNFNYGGTVNNGTEGVGIGLDDYHYNVQVYGNHIEGNEGNGIQFNPNGATGSSRAFGNLLINNFAAPLVRAAGWADYVKAQICSFATENSANIFNNTIILTLPSAAPSCMYGFAEGPTVSGTGLAVQNNLFMRHSVAMKLRTGATRSNNGFYGNGKNVESNADTSTLADGANAVTVNPDLDSSYRPRSSVFKRRGTYIAGTDRYGKHFYNPPNIGAVDDVTATPRRLLSGR